MENLSAFGIALIQAFQTFSPMLDPLMNFFTFLGRIEFYLILVPLIYWNVNPSLGFRLLLLLISTETLGSSLKQLLRQPRPYWIGNVKALSQETSYGIPSTHASNTLAFWGYLAWNIRKAWMWVLSIFLVLMIAISRLYLGVHFPHDVLGGWLLGMVMLLVFVLCEPPFTRWAKKHSMRFRIGLGFLASVLIIVLGLAVLAVIRPFPDPADFVSYSTLARSPERYFTLGGGLFGAVLGYEMMHRTSRFKTGASGIKKLIRYLVGIAGILVIYLGLDYLFGIIAGKGSPADQILRYIRYAAVTWFVSFGAPYLFIKLKLAEREE